MHFVCIFFGSDGQRNTLTKFLCRKLQVVAKKMRNFAASLDMTTRVMGKSSPVRLFLSNTKQHKRQ